MGIFNKIFGKKEEQQVKKVEAVEKMQDTIDIKTRRDRKYRNRVL